MKMKLILIYFVCSLAISASADTRILATVEKVYENSILLNWSPKTPIYGEAHSDPAVSEGNFLGTARSGVAAAQRPIIGYETIFSKEILVVNYPTEGIAEGQKLNIQAVQIGTTNFSGKTIELWDCGIIPITPEQLRQRKEEEAKYQVMVEKQKIEAQKVAQAKNYAAQSNAVHWLLSQASNGSASAQCSLGLHYLNGQGCETNKTFAIFWLEKAALQGNSEASNKMAELK